ncbi:MAG: GUN4 domain-containing protein, partial [Dolichospermum sp.]
IPSISNNPQRIYFFITSQITARGRGENLGYDLFLSGSPRPGMSGGPVLNEEGLLIAIHGKAETRPIIIEGIQRTEIVGVQGIPTEKFPNLISNIQNITQNNTQANTPRNNPSPTNEPTPVSFQRLETLLKAGKWRDADLETWKLMLKLTKREQEGLLELEDVKNFPRQELRKMDQLWVKYSNDKFGFSVQKQIWLELGGKLDEVPDGNTFLKLSDLVGWRVNGKWLRYDGYTFSTNAPKAHLPTGAGWPVALRVRVFSSLDYNP